MQGIRSFSPVLRAIGVIGVVAALVTSITFAALSDTAALEDNEFSTATAALKIWDGASFEDTAVGFSMTDVVPGVTHGPESFELKNTGGVPLAVTVTSTAGTVTGTGSIDDADMVVWTITNTDTADSVSYTHTELISGTPVALPGPDLGAGDDPVYEVTLDVGVDAVSGTSVGVTDLDWTFEGTQPAP